jgi:uncharacterized repeat protein (TIGR03803 family)
MNIRRRRIVMALALSAVFGLPGARAASFETLYKFKGRQDGGAPFAALTYHGGLLYGLSVGGGASQGTLFAHRTGSGPVQVISQFDAMVFGEIPSPALLDQNGTLFGTTSSGGPVNGGTVFSADAKTGRQTTLYAFTFGADGGFPQSGVISDGGALYGTTQIGGPNGNYGTLFRIDPANDAYSLIYSFGMRTGDGAGPNGLLAARGALYGTCETGGRNNEGTVFRVNPATGGEKVLHHFGGAADGALPMSELLDHNGTFFGTTFVGGANDAGTVFAIDPATGAERVLYSFKGKADGANPAGGLAYLNGLLYGTATAGGLFNGVCKVNADSGCGTIFAVDPATGKQTVLHRFSGKDDGAFPYAELTAHGGAMYGSTQIGGRARGADGNGTLFKLTP